MVNLVRVISPQSESALAAAAVARAHEARDADASVAPRAADAVVLLEPHEVGQQQRAQHGRFLLRSERDLAVEVNIQ